MTITQLDLPGVLLFTPRVFTDDRGCFMETFNSKIAASIDCPGFVQDNESRSNKGVLRGLHYQLPRAQGKLVRVVAGKVFDVAVDLRKSSPSFGKWTSAILSGENKHILWIPKGFAHGFLTLSDSAILSYKCTAEYAPEDEKTLLWNDSDLKISRPINGQPLLSPKDERGLLFREAEVYA